MSGRTLGALGATALAPLLLVLGACMHAPGSQRAAVPQRPEPDSATLGLWRFDEPAGRVVADSAPGHLDGTAGIDTRGSFGRFGSARAFTRSIESFAVVPFSPSLDSPQTLSVEAWISPTAFGRFEDTPIACRWTEQANEQSWIFSIVGRRLGNLGIFGTSPRFHESLIQGGALGRLVFVFQPGDAGAPQSYYSSLPIELGRWTHVATTYDGQVVRFYIDDRLDSQYAYQGEIRASHAPLLIGNYFDTRWLTDFSGDTRVGTTADREPYYAFEGMIDELRLSNAARAEFWGPRK